MLRYLKLCIEFEIMNKMILNLLILDSHRRKHSIVRVKENFIT